MFIAAESTAINYTDVSYCDDCGRLECTCNLYSLDMDAIYCEDCGGTYDDSGNMCHCDICTTCGENISMNYCDCGYQDNTPVYWGDEQ